MKKNNGITLIALIITIIIMLILVAVTISILINSGLIGKAKDAKDKTKTAYEEEQRTGDSLNIDGVMYNGVDEYIDSMDKVPVTDVYATVCDNGTLVFSNNVEDINSYMTANNTEIATGYEIQNIVDEEYYYDDSMGEGNLAPWCNSLSITSIKIINDIVPKKTAFWFYRVYGLTLIDGFEKINTSNVTSMESMFTDCNRMSSLDLSSFDTSRVTNMQSMFQDCSSLTSLDLRGFDTSKVTDMSYMFERCMALENLNISNFDTSNVTNMEMMFGSTDDDSLYLTTLDVSSFDTSNVTNMYGMFSGCYDLQELDLSSFDTSNVTNMSNMFYSYYLETIYVSNSFVTDNVTESYGMFWDCERLTGGNGTTYDSNHDDKEYARIDAPGTPGYFTLKSN